MYSRTQNENGSYNTRCLDCFMTIASCVETEKELDLREVAPPVPGKGAGATAGAGKSRRSAGGAELRHFSQSRGVPTALRQQSRPCRSYSLLCFQGRMLSLCSSPVSRNTKRLPSGSWTKTSPPLRWARTPAYSSFSRALRASGTGKRNSG